jgi:peptide/nickel transport system substrate-binding protein
MDEKAEYPDESAAAGEEAAPRPAFRWEWIALGIGLALIVGAVLFTVFNKASETEPEVQPIDYVETQSYREAVVGMPALVNPLLATSQADRDLVALVYSGLTHLDDFGQPVPDLAERWTVSSDGLTYTFYLREGVTWHDGQQFTAQDVAFTLSVLRDPEFTGPADLGAFWQTVEAYALDDTTVQFVLTQPLAAFPEYAGIGILPAHLLAGVDPADLAADSLNLAPVGTGPLRWVSADLDDDTAEVRLEPYDGFYDRARSIDLDEIVLHFYTDPADAFRALGPQVQALGNLTPSQLNAALGSPALNVYSARLPIYAAIIFNQQAPQRLPFFQEREVRKALADALNREGMVADILGRQAVAAVSPLMPGTWGYNPLLDLPAYDPALAAQALDEAGWRLEGSQRVREGQAMTFTLLVADRPADRAIGEAVAGQWQALGVDVSLEVLEAAELVERLQTAEEDQGRDFDAALIEFSNGRLADPDPYAFWHESRIENGQNYSGVSDRDISEALEIARKDPNGVRRAELYRTFQQLFVDRTVAVVLYNPVYHYAVTCQVQGVDLMIFVDPSDRFRNLSEWHIATPEERSRVCPG